jgi:hypothetical protein
MNSIKKWRDGLGFSLAVLFMSAQPLKAEVQFLDLNKEFPWIFGQPNSEQVSSKIEKATRQLAQPLSAIQDQDLVYPESPYLIRLDSVRFFLHPVIFLARKTPNEVCTPDRTKNAPRYFCIEGQRRTNQAHIFVLNMQYQQVGYHQLKLNLPYEYFANAIVAVGTGHKARNEIIAIVQHFPIDRKVASQASEIGSGWTRTAILLRAKQDNDQIIFEQADSCLGNPNTIDNILEARKRLKVCQSNIPQ